jgi:hypothetical protein
MMSTDLRLGLHNFSIPCDNRIEMKKSQNENSLKRRVPSWEDVFSLLNHDDRPTDATRESLARYLKFQVLATSASSSEQTASAYRIAGLLSAQGVRHLSIDDPISKVLELAAQVELPSQHRAITDTWHQLVKSIDQL